ncbi:maleylpyruvate isomerase family mycothiol-dependent enzyme [Mycobacterium deserti]|uniref:Maleylpyruvate isomerase family mycothiol-dependent enzyme n=1 Tax=Mycobacterium deserti TaxID=2978347 RepID=A0ABT2M5E3_9MYCO|nr:maleylpyruvate isomerase family mycothiol-dependent enzyme [Mycobacterium deserti]MCT7656859.1 maleylpyruvate isomerase family mycothiol-dependent enzyme [Mycobacterium deserti]
MSARDLLRVSDLRFNAMAATLSRDEWASPSLCDAWSNHEVLAHLVIGYRTGVGVLTTEMVRHGGSFDRANTALARALARSRGAGELLDDFAVLVTRPRGLGRVFPPRLLLGDHITHELDILFALDRRPAIPPDAVIAVLDTQVAVPNPFVPAFRNSRGLRLRATDVDWAHGERGPVVEGRAVDLVSVLGSRPLRLAHLNGDGVALLASRISPRQTRRAG